MTSFAQAYQDLYVLAMLGKKRGGTYLDVGCYVPKDGNNTFLLDVDYEWDGLNIDRSNFNFRSEPRRGDFLEFDATLPWPTEATISKSKFCHDGIIDYLSLDIDDDTNLALPHALNFAKYRVITIEHDVYARGREQQQYQRNQLTESGYILHVPDVYFPSNPDLVFEDWWISQEIADGKQMTQGPHDAAKVVQDLWLEKFGEDLNIYPDGVPAHDLMK